MSIGEIGKAGSSSRLMCIQRDFNAILLCTRTGFTIASTIALALITSSGFSDATSEAKKQIQAAYDTESAAASKKDFKAMFAHYAPDFVATLAKGRKVGLAELKQRTEKAYSLLVDIHDKAEITGFALGKTQALVRIKEHSDAAVYNVRTKETGRLVVDTLSDDVWEKKGASWVKKRSHTINTRQDYKTTTKPATTAPKRGPSK